MPNRHTVLFVVVSKMEPPLGAVSAIVNREVGCDLSRYSDVVVCFFFFGGAQGFGLQDWNIFYF